MIQIFSPSMTKSGKPEPDSTVVDGWSGVDGRPVVGVEGVVLFRQASTCSFRVHEAFLASKTSSPGQLRLSRVPSLLQVYTLPEQVSFGSK